VLDTPREKRLITGNAAGNERAEALSTVNFVPLPAALARDAEARRLFLPSLSFPLSLSLFLFGVARFSARNSPATARPSLLKLTGV